uniref:40S ribosomal protein S4 n=1 Tax=Ursus americanus TaxID=9643 RepID=A0A452SDF9_URSAM
MLDKLTSVFAPHPSAGPHKLRVCLHLIIFLRNRLRYALTGVEVKICMQCFIKIDGKAQTYQNLSTYTAGFMDVINTDKTGENFYLIDDTKGCFAVHWIITEEAKYKLCKVRKNFVGTKGISHLVIHDAPTVHCPDPLTQVNDTIQTDLEIGKITDFIKFDTGNLISRRANLERIGVIISRERYPGSFDEVHVEDANGNSFATQLSNIFFYWQRQQWTSLPRGKGICLTIAEERDKRLTAK